MKTILATSLLFALSAATIGCLGDPGGSMPVGPSDPNDPSDPSDPDPMNPDDPPPPPLTAAKFVHDQNVKTCDYAHACRASAGDPATFDAMYGTTAASCYGILDTNARIPSIEGSIGAGRIVYNEIAANSCLGAMAAPSDCGAFFAIGPTYPSVCSEALIGTVADGELCAVSYDCLNSDSACDIENNICVALGAPDDGND